MTAMSERTEARILSAIAWLSVVAMLKLIWWMSERGWL